MKKFFFLPILMCLGVSIASQSIKDSIPEYYKLPWTCLRTEAIKIMTSDDKYTYNDTVVVQNEEISTFNGIINGYSAEVWLHFVIGGNLKAITISITKTNRSEFERIIEDYAKTIGTKPISIKKDSYQWKFSSHAKIEIAFFFESNIIISYLSSAKIEENTSNKNN